MRRFGEKSGLLVLQVFCLVLTLMAGLALLTAQTFASTRGWGPDQASQPATALDDQRAVLEAAVGPDLAAESMLQSASWPVDPPIASVITIGEADIEGNATVTGTAGAVEPLSPIFLASPETSRVTTTIASADGSFQATVFAPPGAWVQIKQGLDPRDPPLDTPEQDASWFNALPGTLLRAAVPDGGPEGALPFAAAGGIDPFGGSGDWMVQGHTVTDTVDSNIMLHIAGTMRVTTPAITATFNVTDTEVLANVAVRRFFDDEGRRVPVHGVFVSTFMTPTGLPISREVIEQSPISTTFSIRNWTQIADRVIQATVSGTVQIPASTQAGYYRPRILFHFQGIPLGTPYMSTRLGVGQSHRSAYLPVLRIGDPEPPRLIWTLLSDTLSDATRGTVARHDKPRFGLSSHIITQADVFIAPRLHPRTQEPIVYRLEPFLPLVSLADRSLAAPPLLPFDLPGGSLQVTVEDPNGVVENLGSAPFQQSISKGLTNRDPNILDDGGGRIDDLYQLTTLNESFLHTFEEYGHHVITLTGSVEDIWGNVYLGNGTYDVYVARSLKIDTGQLPTTPYEVGDAFSPLIHVYPAVPAEVQVRLVHMANSDPSNETIHTINGTANRFGYFHSHDSSIVLTSPGEFRVDIVAAYEEVDGTLWMGSATWGNVVQATDPPIIGRGRRGFDLSGPNNLAWFFHRNLGITVPGLHTMYPYYSGDIFWGSEVDDQVGGYAIIPAVSIHDTEGTIETIIEDRWGTKQHSTLYEGLSFEERVQQDELPLFSTTANGMDLFWSPDLIDQYGYNYRTSERPGVRVHETISEDALDVSYWRFIAEFGLQAGSEGDMPNDLKWEFGGSVFRVISETDPINEYAIYGSLWVLLPDNDAIGSRVAPPFQGSATGPDGGPIMTLKGDEIDLFLMPKGVQPGDILEVGNRFSFSGHVGPPLASAVTVRVTSPTEVVRTITGRANRVGWFYEPDSDFVVDVPGLWTVEVEVVQDQPIASTGAAPSPPHNSGGVLGSADGSYSFYVVVEGASRLPVLSPQPGYISWPLAGDGQTPVTVTTVPVLVPTVTGLADASLDYTIRMPGFILEEGTLAPSGGLFTIVYDPVALHDDFPNLDLKAFDATQAGLADYVLISFLLSGRLSGEDVHWAGAVFLRGDEVQMPRGSLSRGDYLALVLRRWATGT